MAKLRPGEAGVGKLGLEPAPRASLTPTHSPWLKTAGLCFKIQPPPGCPISLGPDSQGQEPSGLCSSTPFSRCFLSMRLVPGTVPGAGGTQAGEEEHLPPPPGGEDRSSNRPSKEMQGAHLVEPLDLLFLVFPLPGERAQLILQVLELLAQLLGLCCQLLLVSLQGTQGWSAGSPSRRPERTAPPAPAPHQPGLLSASPSAVPSAHVKTPCRASEP